MLSAEWWPTPLVSHIKHWAPLRRHRPRLTVVVLEGDYGGQIYGVAPAREVRCSEDVLTQLQADIDEGLWADEDGARVYCERRALAAGIAGGMGGGVVAAEIWGHPKLSVLQILIREVFRGERGGSSGLEISFCPYCGIALARRCVHTRRKGAK